jgi:hypothetical protein
MQIIRCRIFCLSIENPKILKQTYTTVIFLLCWSFTLAEEHRLRVLENRVLRKVFGPKRDEVTGDFRRMHNEALYDLYSSTNII